MFICYKLFDSCAACYRRCSFPKGCNRRSDYRKYIGRFRNNKLGNYSMYVTDMNNLILVRTGNKKYVFSCSRPQEFVGFVNLQLKR